MNLLHTIRRFLKIHPIQRLVVTLLVMAIVGMLIGMWALPIYIDRSLRSDLLNAELPTPQRIEAEDELCLRCLDLPDTMARVTHWMDTAETDAEFLALRRVMLRIQKFYTDEMNTDWLGRMSAIHLLTVAEANAKKPPRTFAPTDDDGQKTSLHRQQILLDELAAIAPSKFAPRIAQTAKRDPDPRVRELALQLEFHLTPPADLPANHWAWADPAPRVVAAIALQAHLRNIKCNSIARKKFTEYLTEFESIIPPLNTAPPHIIIDWNRKAETLRDAVANSALALLDGGESELKFLLETIEKPLEPNLRDRLWWALVQTTIEPLSRCDSPSHRARAALVREAIIAEFARCKTARILPSPLLIELLANDTIAPEIGLDTLVDDILSRAANRENTPPVRHVLAGILAAKPREKTIESIAKLCTTYWTPNAPLLFTAAPKTLGELLQTRQSDDGQITIAIHPRLQTLATGALEEMALAFQNTDKAQSHISSILSASAGCALWLNTPSLDEFPTLKTALETPSKSGLEELAVEKTSLLYLRTPLTCGVSEPIEFTAETIRNHNKAFKLGMRLLRGPNPEKRLREFDPNVRFTGMMLLALSAKTPEQIAQATATIGEKLNSKIPNEADTATCALAILGDQPSLEKTHNLLFENEFPIRRPLLALLETPSTRHKALAILLLNPNWSADERRYLLIEEYFQPTVRTAATYLPKIPLAANEELQRWLLRNWRATFIVQLSKK